MTNFGRSNGGNKGEKWGLFGLWGRRQPLPAEIHPLTALVVASSRGLAARHLTAAEMDALKGMIFIFIQCRMFRVNRDIHQARLRALSQMPFFLDDIGSRFYHHIDRGPRHHRFGAHHLQVLFVETRSRTVVICSCA